MDIGGGTTDIALLSLSGIVCKYSVKLAGNRFDEEIIRYIRTKYTILIGQRTAEEIKKSICTCDSFDDERTFVVKGRNLLTGLPGKVTVGWWELSDAMCELASQLAESVQKVFEKAPPELSGDLKADGFLMTGGGSKLNGLDKYFEKRFNIKCNVAQDSEDCVAYGTAKSFKLSGYLRDCVFEANNRLHE